MFIYPFEKLQAWHAARKMIVFVYKLTAKFPLEERYGISLQLRRAAISVASNLSEGSGRLSAKDQGHFYNISYSSLMEALNQVIIAKDLDWISDSDYDELRSYIEPLSGTIGALRKSILNKADFNTQNK
jgi:four helix bundle protein